SSMKLDYMKSCNISFKSRTFNALESSKTYQNSILFIETELNQTLPYEEKYLETINLIALNTLLETIRFWLQSDKTACFYGMSSLDHDYVYSKALLYHSLLEKLFHDNRDRPLIVASLKSIETRLVYEVLTVLETTLWTKSATQLNETLNTLEKE